MQKIQAGHLDRKLTIQQRIKTVNTTTNEDVFVYQTLAEVRGKKIEKEGGTEKFELNQTIAESKTQFIIRYRADIRPDMLILCEGVTYDITAQNEYGETRRQWLIIDTKQRK